MKVEDSELENEQNITPEERKNIAHEMEQILASRQRVAPSNKLTMSNSTKLFSFPIYMNIIIFILFLVSVGGVYAYFVIQDTRFLNVHEQTNFSENVLARLIIDEARQAIEEQESKIKSINDQLKEEEKKKFLLGEDFEERTEKFIAEAEKELNVKLEEFHKKLESQNIIPAEIKRRLKEYERILRVKYEEELARYKAKQRQLKEREITQFNVKIENLQQQANDRKLQLQSLEQNLDSERTLLEKQLQQQRELSSQEIVKAQKQITDLKKRNEQRVSALESLTIMYRVALNSLNDGRYDDVRQGIQNFNTALKQSAYKDDKELLRMKNSLVSISRALETIGLLEKQVLQQSQSLDNIDYGQDSQELEEKIVLLEKDLATLNQDSQSKKNVVAAREKELKMLTGRYQSLEGQYKAIKTDVSKNMQVIVNYLMVKKQKGDAKNIASLKTLVDDLVTQDKYYGVLGILLAQALDPSGELQF